MKKIFLLLLSAAVLSGCGPAKRARAMKDAISAAQKDNWENALAAAKSCQTPQDDNPDAIALLAVAQLKLDESKLPESLEAMNKAVDAAPERYDLQYIRGVYLMKHGEYEDALASLQNAYQLHTNKENNSHVPESVQGAIKYCIYLCCAKLHKNSLAIEYLEKAMMHADYSQSPDLENNMAVLLMREKKYDLAVARLNKLKESNPNRLEYIVNLAICCDHLSQPQNSPKYYATYKGIVPGWYKYAMQLTKKQMTTATPEAQKALQQLYSALDSRLKKLAPAPQPKNNQRGTKPKPKN